MYMHERRGLAKLLPARCSSPLPPRVIMCNEEAGNNNWAQTKRDAASNKNDSNSSAQTKQGATSNKNDSIKSWGASPCANRL